MTSEPPVAAERNQGYDLLRIIAICGVVAIHVFGLTAANPDIAGTADSWVARIFATGSIWSVPVFVMLSGALTLADRAHMGGLGRFYSRRLRRILPALVFWTIVYLLIRIVVLDEPMFGWKIVSMLVDATVYPHLYFLWLIAGLYLVSPILHAFLAAGGTRRAVWFAASALGFTLLAFTVPRLLALGDIERPIQLGALTFWIAYIGYFLVGHAVSRFDIARRWAVVAALGVAALGGLTIVQAAYPEYFGLLSVLSPVEYLGTVVAILSICVLIAGVYLLGRLPLGPRLGRVIVTLSEASFGVYLVHFVVLLVPYELLPGFHEHRSAPEALLAWIVVLAVSFAISIGARRVPVLRAVF